MPWLLLAGVAGAAWWWERSYRGKGEKGGGGSKKLGRHQEEDDDEEYEDEVQEIDWTDEPIKKSRRRRAAQLADISGPISDTYIQPVKLAAKGECEEAVRLLDRQSRASEGAYGPRKTPVVRRALRRSAVAVTEKCPKEVSALLGSSEALREELEPDVALVQPSTARAFVHPRESALVPRTRGEAGRFKKRTQGGDSLEYRKKGDTAWRVKNLKTGEETEKKMPTGKPRGRPKKLL